LESNIEDERVRPIVEALVDWGAVTMDNERPTLTPFGVCATELNEGNPLLIAKLYTSGLLKDATASEIVAVLGSCIMDREAEEKTVHPRNLGPHISDRVKDALLQIDEWGRDGVRIDRTHGIVSPDGFWSLTTLWCEIGVLWIEGETARAILDRFDIYEGNLMKGLLKLTAIVNEWIAVATYKADVDMLEKCKNISQTMLRDIAQPESLYLRL
jgi:superfamily II RNA helicase